jgi:DNA invertase Pin-like site-specific DNA recombinase
MMEPEQVKRFEREGRALVNAACDDPEALAQAVVIMRNMQDQLHQAVIELQAQGFSWTDIAKALGITRQSAWKKYRVG